MEVYHGDCRTDSAGIVQDMSGARPISTRIPDHQVSVERRPVYPAVPPGPPDQRLPYYRPPPGHAAPHMALQAPGCPVPQYGAPAPHHQQHQQGLVCTCPPPGVPPDRGAAGGPPPPPPLRRSASRGSNFSEDSLADAVAAEAGAKAGEPRAAPAEPHRVSAEASSRGDGAYRDDGLMDGLRDDERSRVDPRRLSQAYGDRPASPDQRHFGQAYDDRPPVSSDQRRLAYDDRPAVSSDQRRLSQAYDDRPAVSTDQRRLSQAYDDRPAVSTDQRRLSQAYDDRLAVSSDQRRLSQAYDDRPAVSSDQRRLSQAYDDRPAMSTDQRRLSQAYDDRPAVSSDQRRLSQAYDDRPAVSSDQRRLSQAYDDRPAVAGYPADASGRSGEADLSGARGSPPRQAPAAVPDPAGGDQRAPSADRSDATGDPRPPCQKYDDRPCTAAADPAVPAAVADKPWWEKTPEKSPPRAKSASKDGGSRRSSTDRSALAAPGAGDTSPMAFTVQFGQPEKRLHVKDSISRWAPRGRRPPPAADTDDKHETRSDSGDRKAAVTARSGVPRPRRRPGPLGYHSEGYFSSDQDIDSATFTRPNKNKEMKRSALARTPSPRRQQRPAAGRLSKSATLGTMPAAPPPAEDPPDNVSEAGTYTIENEEDTTRSSSPDTSSKPSAYSSGGSNWIEQWAAEVTKHNKQNVKRAAQKTSPTGAPAKPPSGSGTPWSGQTSSPDGARPRRKLPTPPGITADQASAGRPGALSASLETESYLRTTEDVMSALQARIDASQTGPESDSESESSSEAAAAAAAPAGKPPPAASQFKFNRALSLRRARLGLDTDSVTSGSSKRPTPPPAGRPSSGSGRKHQSDSEATPGMSRSDGGRYSLRAANGTPKTQPSRGGALGGKKAGAAAAGPARQSPGQRAAAQGAQVARDQEMANWKRRKNYDPLKAAREDRKKRVERGGSQSDSACPAAAPLRSASFHGTDGLASASLRRAAFAAASEDERHLAARRRSPLVTGRSPASGPAAAAAAAAETEEGFQDSASAASSTRKVSLEGRRSRGASPMLRGQTPTALRNKVKLEALDNLVISTIHTLSSKIRGNSESLVSKLKCQFDEDDVRHTLLDDVMTTLTTDAPAASKTASRDLAGILKNLRKVEQAVQVLEQVLCDDDCDASDAEDELYAADKFGDGFY